jgi:hypothetical protein
MNLNEHVNESLAEMAEMLHLAATAARHIAEARPMAELDVDLLQALAQVCLNEVMIRADQLNPNT